MAAGRSLLLGLVAICLSDIATVHCGSYLVGGACALVNGNAGICTPVRRCPSALRVRRANGTLQVCLQDERSQPVVCCPASEARAQPAGREEPPLPRPPRPDQAILAGFVKTSKSKRHCRLFGEDVFRTFVQSDSMEGSLPVCAHGAQELIVGGTKCLPKEYPHMAALGFGTKTNIAWLCGGSLVSHTYVLTTASCTFSRGSGIVKWIRLGDLNFATNTVKSRPQTHEVGEVVLHPAYKAPSHYNDIALLKVKTYVEFTEYARAACLNTDSILPVGSIVTAVGWGLTNWTNDHLSEDLMQVDLKVETSKRCNDSYRSLITGSTKLTKGFTEDTMICAGDPQNRRDTCVGDSGGPLQISLAEPFCTFSIVGLTSFGSRDCGESNIPAVYTRVSHYVPWIEGVVWP